MCVRATALFCLLVSGLHVFLSSLGVLIVALWASGSPSLSKNPVQMEYVRVYGAKSWVKLCMCSPHSYCPTVHVADFGRCGSVAVVEMLHRTNLLALVGGGQAPKFPNTKVMIWDDSQSKFAYELLFRTAVLAVRMKRDRCVLPTVLCCVSPLPMSSPSPD